MLRGMDSDQGSFLIVDLGDYAELVPDLWVSRDRQWTHFPKTTNYKALRRAVYLRETPKRSWKMLPINEILDSSSSYLDGRRKQDKAQLWFDARQIEEAATENQLNGSGVEEVSNGVEDQLCQNCTDIKQILDSISLRLDTISQKLDNVLENQSQEPRSETTFTESCILEDVDSQLSVNLPVKSNDELIALDAELGSEATRRKLFLELKKIGGRNTKDIAVRVLKYLISNAVAEKYSWLGKKGKKIFSSLRNIYCLIEETVRHHNPSITEVQLITMIQVWLRHAKDRNIRDKEKEAEEAGSQLRIKEECSMIDE